MALYIPFFPQVQVIIPGVKINLAKWCRFVYIPSDPVRFIMSNPMRVAHAPNGVCRNDLSLRVFRGAFARPPGIRKMLFLMPEMTRV